jgi:hypothetical protein
MLCRKDLQKSLQTKTGPNLVMLVLLERDNFCLDFVFSLSIYAVVCSNVVVHNSDHNCALWSLLWTTTEERRAPSRCIEEEAF